MTALIQQQAIADFILHTNAGTPRVEFIPALAQLVARGQPSIKVFMVGADFGASLGAFVQLLEAARDAGVVTLVHCEDGALLAAAGWPALAEDGVIDGPIAELVVSNIISTWPPSTAVRAWSEPLCGTCTMFTPAIDLKSSPAM